MEKIELTVRGEGASDLAGGVSGFADVKRTDYEGDGFVVVVGEEYFLRTNSDLQATVVVEFVDETTAKGGVIAGGGGRGLLGLSLGSESTAAGNVFEGLAEYCEEHDLETERHESE